MFDDFDIQDPFEDDNYYYYNEFLYWESLELEHEEWLIRNQEEEEDY